MRRAKHEFACFAVGCILSSLVQAFSIVNFKSQLIAVRKNKRFLSKPAVLHESPVHGDRFREATGIRPSLHPTAINAIAEALKIRALNDSAMPLRVNANVKSVDVAITAGKIAATAIKRRQTSSTNDGMQFTPEECQTLAGRVLGVVMRLEELEKALVDKVSKVSWVRKYNAWDSFGVSGPDTDNTETENKIKDDPLFRMNRSECLLALFLKTVETPQLAKVGHSVPDKSTIDFLDSDRMEALFADLA